MKVVLLHGPAIRRSREQLIVLKSKFNSQNIQVFDSSSNPKDLMGNLMTLPLIPEARLIVLENIGEDLSLEKLSDSDDLTLIFWFEKELGEKSNILKFVKNKKGEILNFPEGKEASVFPFLDNLGNKDKKAFLELDKLKKSGADSQYLITMILYLLRSLVSPNKNAPSFVKEKIARQQRNFPEGKVKDLYKFVLETDFKIKSGLIEKDQAEFLIVNKFLA